MPFLALGKHEPGGVGHCLYDRFALLAVGRMFGMTPVVPRVVVNATVRHGMAVSGRDPDALEGMLGITRLPGAVTKVPRGATVKGVISPRHKYSQWTVPQFRLALSALGPLADNDVVLLEKNVRLNLEALYFTGSAAGKALYAELRGALRGSFKLDPPPRLTDGRFHVAVHVRSGDRSAAQQPMDYALSALQALVAHPACPTSLLIHVVSAGAPGQMRKLRAIYGVLPPDRVVFDLNIDFFDTLAICTQASVVCVWRTTGKFHSGFHYLMRLYASEGTRVLYSKAPGVEREEELHARFGWGFIEDVDWSAVLSK